MSKRGAVIMSESTSRSQLFGSVVVLMIACMLVPVHAQETLPPFLKMAPYETEKLGEGLYSFRWGAYRNIFLVTDQGVIATDPMGVESAAVFRQEIAKITDRPVKYVVYSQSHWDHVTGAGIFKDEGAIIVGHEKAAENIKERPNPGLIEPDITFSDTYSIELGGRRLDLYYFGPADDDAGIVMVPSTEPILYVTDTLNPAANQTIPWNPQVPDLHFHNVIPFLKSVEALGEKRGLKSYVGGHVVFAMGPDGRPAVYPTVGPFAQIAEKRALYERIFAAVKAEVDKGTPAKDVPAALDPGVFRGLFIFDKASPRIFALKIAEYFEAGR